MAHRSAPPGHSAHSPEGLEGSAGQRSDELTERPQSSEHPSARTFAEPAECGSAEVLALAAQRAQRGESYVLLTVVRVQRPTSGKPGDKALLTASGEWFGWVGGSCAEPSARRLAVAALACGEPRLLRLTNDANAEPSPGVEILPMSCFSGGALDIFIEPHHPQPHLFVLGQSPVAKALVRLGEAMRYRVLQVDEVPGAQPEVPALDTGGLGWPSRPPAQAVVVVASHGRKEKAALAWALAGAARYVGLVASRRRCEAVRQQLSDSGVSEQALVLLDSPAGLDIGGRGPEEVALSILARVVQQARQGVDGRVTEPDGRTQDEGQSATRPVPQ